jgi:hypothetical protein
VTKNWFVARLKELQGRRCEISEVAEQLRSWIFPPGSDMEQAGASFNLHVLVFQAWADFERDGEPFGADELTLVALALGRDPASFLDDLKKGIWSFARCANLDRDPGPEATEAAMEKAYQRMGQAHFALTDELRLEAKAVKDTQRIAGKNKGKWKRHQAVIEPVIADCVGGRLTSPHALKKIQAVSGEGLPPSRSTLAAWSKNLRERDDIFKYPPSLPRKPDRKLSCK